MDTAHELKALRVQLLEREREVSILRAAIGASPAGILIASAPGGVIEEWNAAALGVRGSNSSEDLTPIPLELPPTRGQTFHPNGELYAPEELPLSRARLHGEMVAGEDVIIRDKSGDKRRGTGHAAPVYAEGKLVAGVVVFRTSRHAGTPSSQPSVFNGWRSCRRTSSACGATRGRSSTSTPLGSRCAG